MYPLDPLDEFSATAVQPDLSSKSSSKDYYDVTISNIPIQVGKKYRAQFWYFYHNDDPKITQPVKGTSSATIYLDADLPDYTKPVTNIVLTPGYKNYQVKFDITSFPGFVDLVIYESPTGLFNGEEFIVYAGTSNQATILTTDMSPRYVKVIARDQWLHSASATQGPVTPKNPDPDTSTPPSPPSNAAATGSIDENDKSGFGGKFTATWTASTDTNVGGYVIRWTPDNPASITNPNWEYGQVEGKASTSFTITGLLLNTVYYYQITAKSPYNALSWTASPVQTLPAIVDSTAGGAWSRIKSYLSIGGATEDLFKIGTGITQKINNSTTTTPSYTADTYVSNGIILNKSTTNVGNNYWLNSGKFRIGNETSFLFWDGINVYTTGKINATGGSFTGDVQLNGGSLYAGTSPNSGQRMRLNSSGIFGYDSSGIQTFSVDTAGQLTAISGSVAGWVLGSSTLSKNGAIIDSAGKISLGTTANASVYLSAVDPTYRIWVGNNNGANASFSVDASGVMRATGAIISGTLGVGTQLSTGTSLSTIETNASTAVSTANTASTAATNAYNKAVAAQTDATAAATKAQQAYDSAALKVAAADVANAINTNTTKIDGAKIVTGSIELSTLKVVGDTANGLTIDNNGIRAYSGSVQTFNLSTTGSLALRGTIYSTTGTIGGFTMSNGDLSADFTVAPRILFGSKINIGWESGYPYSASNVFNIVAGSNTGSQSQQFYINTNTDVFRFAADSSTRTYAGEVRNALRAAPIRSIGAVVTETSSRRFKENISATPKRYYDKILDVEPMFYTYKDQEDVLPELRGHHRFGMIAEDLEEAGLGYFVERDIYGQPTNLMDMMSFPLLLIPIVKEMKNEIALLNEKIIELEANK